MTCDQCNSEMTAGGTCAEVPFPSGSAPLPNDWDGNCPDCAVRPAGFHHPGCDRERCPDCSGQAISCDCE